MKWSPRLAETIFLLLFLAALGTVLTLWTGHNDFGVILSVIGLLVDSVGLCIGRHDQWLIDLGQDRVSALVEVFMDPTRRWIVKILLGRGELSLDQLVHVSNEAGETIPKEIVSHNLIDLQQVIYSHEKPLSPNQDVLVYGIKDEYKAMFFRNLGHL